MHRWVGGKHCWVHCCEGDNTQECRRGVEGGEGGGRHTCVVAHVVQHGTQQSPQGHLRAGACAQS